MVSNRERWNELYQRADQPGRPRAEVDSVPQAHDWGAVAAAERADFQWWLQHVQPGSRMLDAGCGNGSHLASMVSRHAGAGVGVDVSDVAIELGKERLRAAGLGDRMTLERRSFHDELPSGPFDLIYSLYALQFTRASQLPRLASRLATALRAGGLFCLKVRSTSRSVHGSYVPLDGEPNTYCSHEPHELGMVYHHYSEDDIALFERALRGTLLHAEELKETRDYDRFSDRAWWQVVIRARPVS